MLPNQAGAGIEPMIYKSNIAPIQFVTLFVTLIFHLLIKAFNEIIFQVTRVTATWMLSYGICYADPAGFKVLRSSSRFRDIVYILLFVLLPYQYNMYFALNYQMVQMVTNRVTF